MIGETNFSDLIRIYQIRGRPKQSKFLPERNKNFQEFTNVYKEVFYGSLNRPSALKNSYRHNSRPRYTAKYPARPLHDVKKIRIEMPVLGAENAIVTTMNGRKESVEKVVEKTDKCLYTEHEITKWGQEAKKEKIKRLTSGKDHTLLEDTRELLQQTKQEIDESAAQIKVIKSLISQIKPPEKIKKSRTPTYKAKRKPDRHADCLNKKYVSTLNTMQQKLQKLEEKYFSKPHVVYKNVRDICTEYSDVDVLYENSSSSADVALKEALKGIKQELDNIANAVPEPESELKAKPKTVTFKTPEVELSTVGDTYDEVKKIYPLNLSFKKSVSLDEKLAASDQENYAKLIDQSENFLKKYQFLTDVENFCENICNIDKEDDKGSKVELNNSGDSQDIEPIESKSAEHDSDSHDSDVDSFYHCVSKNDDFLNKDLEAVISSSSYLSREFNGMKPNVKVFSGTGDRYVSNKYFGNTSKQGSSVKNSIADLIANLSINLKDSIYKPA